MGPNGLRTGHRKVSQSHFGEVAAAGFPDDSAQSVRSRSRHNPRNRVPGRPWLVATQSGTDTVWRLSLDELSLGRSRSVDLAQAGRRCPVIARGGHIRMAPREGTFTAPEATRVTWRTYPADLSVCGRGAASQAKSVSCVLRIKRRRRYSSAVPRVSIALLRREANTWRVRTAVRNSITYTHSTKPETNSCASSTAPCCPLDYQLWQIPDTCTARLDGLCLAVRRLGHRLVRLRHRLHLPRPLVARARYSADCRCHVRDEHLCGPGPGFPTECGATPVRPPMARCPYSDVRRSTCRDRRANAGARR